MTVDNESDLSMLNLGGFYMEVTRDFDKRGDLVMQNPDDHLLVRRDVEIFSAELGTGLTTHGVFEAQGDFGCGLYTSHTGAYFQGSGEHLVRLTGSEQQEVRMRSWGCVFNDLEVENTADDSVDPAVVMYHSHRRVGRDVTVLDGRVATSDDVTWVVIGRDLADENALWEALTVMEGVDPDGARATLALDTVCAQATERGRRSARVSRARRGRRRR